MSDLADRRCEPKQAGLERLERTRAEALLSELDADWSLDADAGELVRTFTVKGFAKAAYLAGLVAFHADRQGHHPDIAFGWGYCRVRYTTHDIGGLSENDFICAARLDRLVAE